MARTFSQISFDFREEAPTLPGTTDTPAKTADNGPSTDDLPSQDVTKDPQQEASLSQDGKTQHEAGLSQDKQIHDAAILSRDGETQDKATLSQDGEALEEVIFSQDGESRDGNIPERAKETAVSKKRPDSAGTKSGRGRKSQKTYAAEADLVEIPDDEILFQRQYYAIGEVAQMFKVNPSLLRFWESEFDIIKPRKNRKGDRHFRPTDIKNLQLIYDLLRRRKLTIDGARDFIRNSKKAQERFEMIQSLQKIRTFLLEIKAAIS